MDAKSDIDALKILKKSKANEAEKGKILKTTSQSEPKTSSEKGRVYFDLLAVEKL